MALADTQQQRLRERLRQAGEQPVAFAELRAGGIDFPAAVVFELELNGYAIERAYDYGPWSACVSSPQNLRSPRRPTGPLAALVASIAIRRTPHAPR